MAAPGTRTIGVLDELIGVRDPLQHEIHLVSINVSFLARYLATNSRQFPPSVKFRLVIRIIEAGVSNASEILALKDALEMTTPKPIVHILVNTPLHPDETFVVYTARRTATRNMWISSGLTCPITFEQATDVTS